jgi:hypothetical protein
VQVHSLHADEVCICHCLVLTDLSSYYQHAGPSSQPADSIRGRVINSSISQSEELPTSLPAPSSSAQRIPHPAASHDSQESSNKKTSVLGRMTLSAIYEDLSRTELPSWVSRAPANFGTKARGKLSADQWRTLATIYLPISLIRLWGNETGRRKAMLDNFMDLVTAVEVGGMLVVDEEHIRKYEETILRYLQNMKSLYLEASIKPNHHLAIHLAVFLRLFGPVHAWRAFAFERFNYMLQRLNKNMHIGAFWLSE